MVPAAIASVHASVQCAAVKITTLSASAWSRLPLQLMRATFCASTIPRTDATFGYSLLTSCLPQVMAPAIDDIPTTMGTTANSAASLVLMPVSTSMSTCFELWARSEVGVEERLRDRRVRPVLEVGAAAPGTERPRVE